MTVPRTGSKRLLRDLNQSILFNLIAEEQAISRTRLAEKSGLPAATVTRIIREFISAGLVIEVKIEASSGGRRPVLLSINPAAGYTVGVKLRENGMTMTICDLRGSIIRDCEQTFPGGTSPQQIIERISMTMKQLVRKAGLSLRQILGLGVGLGGLIDSEHGICRYSPLLGWHNVELAPALQFRLHVPVCLDNDVNTLAIGERLFGQGRGTQNFLLITIGRGIGMGIIIDGKIYRGEYGGAGEFGHMTIDLSPDAPRCICGKRGCLDAVASYYGILQAATHRDPGYRVREEITTLIEQARAGDTALQAIFHRAGEALGIAIANVITLFDPERIVISGEGILAGDVLLKPLQEAIPPHIFGPPRERALIFTPIKETDWARGAACLILQRVFQPPIYEDDEYIHPFDSLLTQRTSR